MRKVCDMCGGTGKQMKYEDAFQTATGAYNTCPMCGGQGYVEDMVQQTMDSVINVVVKPDEIKKIIEEKVQERIDEEFSAFQSDLVRYSDHFDPRLMRIVENKVTTELMRVFYPRVSEYIEAAMRKHLPEILKLAISDYFPKDEGRDGDDK